MERNIWLDGMMGLVTGDALGNPVQFMERSRILQRGPVTGMEAGGVYDTPAGTWTDDSSMALATLDSIREIGEISPEDIMLGFARWYFQGEYTPFGKSFDMGGTCSQAIENYAKHGNWRTCGMMDEWSNGNGALMRILPVCLHYIELRMNGELISDVKAISGIHDVTALTHNHLRAKIASGLYFFMSCEAAKGEGDLKTRLQKGIDRGRTYYGRDTRSREELCRFERLFDLSSFMILPEEKIKSTGYVVNTLEAAVWSLITTESFRDALVRAVNLGDDADTVGAVAGGLAGLYYGYGQIPEDWLVHLQRREWIEDLCTSDFSSEIPVADIHAHLIPGVDDGSVNMEMTMQMIRSEYRQGVRMILCTPHADGLVYPKKVKAGWNEIKKRCSQEFPDLKLGLGCEIYLTPEYLDDCVELLEKGVILPLNGSKYVLVEFPQTGIPFEDIRTCVVRLVERGWIPVIAHAERYEKSYSGIEDIHWLKEHRCRIQVNIYSIKEDFSEKRKTLVQEMLNEKLVDFLGTDAHRMDHRPPKVYKGIQELIRKSGSEYAKQIAFENVMTLITVSEQSDQERPRCSK